MTIQMASFESKASTKAVTDSEIQKYPIRRLEPSIQRFLKVIEIDIERLHKHRMNIEKFSRLSDWANLNQEQTNASRTVQQIKANVKEIEKTRKQVVDEDLELFDKKTENMKQMAVAGVLEFIHVNSTDKVDENDHSEISNTETLRQPFLSTQHDGLDLAYTSLPFDVDTHQLQIHAIPENSEAYHSWEELQESLVELNQLVHEFASSVQTQQESVDRIEDNIESVHGNIQQGTLQLGKAAKYKAAIFPIAGALIGTVVGGPFGLVAGAKIGGVFAAVTGGALG
ncbi:hypothetical protein KUTeg_001629 [Tegillarca granosa]|uniref:t-SNARE coiled-coil homology domain-containing protein n=1 Tax=Tegillarca granosa TaxID=220873 RepID=A0ABQ9FTI8_TEGGR|nr:hypothetical protein KUTeg_001629 [Tegillarca granosa]